MKSLFIAIGFIGLGVGYLWLAAQLPGPRADDVLGPRAMPFALGVILIVLAVVLAAEGLRRRREDKEWGFILRSHMVVLVGVTAYVALMPVVGFKAATAVFLFLGALWAGHRGTSAGLFTIGVLAVLYLLFELLFKVALPRGIV